MLQHVGNDWLAACWFFLICSLLWTIGSLFYITISKNQRQDFVYASSLADALLFTIGSAYFVAGSYLIESVAAHTTPATMGVTDYIDAPTTNKLHLHNDGGQEPT